ncbi:MAG: MlaD family protein [Candidatus Dormibacteria bacterium]
MRSRRNLPVFLGYALFCLLVLGFMARQMGGEFFLADQLRVNADFTNASGLVAGDDVTVNGLRVGEVESLTSSATGVRATLLMHREDGPVHTDARAVIRSKNLLGEAFVEVTRGDSAQPVLADRGLIDSAHTLSPVELDQVLDALNPDVRQRLTIAVNSLGEATAGRGQDLNTSAGDLKQLSSDLDTLSQTLATDQGHVDTLVISLAKVVATLAQYHSEFRGTITQWDSVMKTLGSHESDLAGTFQGQDQVLGILDQALSASSPAQLHDALAQAPATLDNLNHYSTDATPVFAGLAQHSVPIGALFRELDSVMSATDSQGNHLWRVYNVGNCQNVANPYVPCPAHVP